MIAASSCFAFSGNNGQNLRFQSDDSLGVSDLLNSPLARAVFDSTPADQSSLLFSLYSDSTLLGHLHSGRSAWPLYIRCDNLTGEVRNTPGSKALLMMIELPPQSPHESDDVYKHLKSVMFLRIIEAVLEKMVCWSSCGFQLHIPGSASPVTLVPRLMLLIADMMELRMLAATYGSFSVRCLTRVLERRLDVLPDDSEDDAAREPSSSTAPADIAFSMAEIEDAVHTPAEPVCHCTVRVCNINTHAFIHLSLCRRASTRSYYSVGLLAVSMAHSRHARCACDEVSVISGCESTRNIHSS